MKNDIVIKVENLSKNYKIGKQESYLTLRDKIVELPQRFLRKEVTKNFWALKNVNFTVNKGEVIGLIGRNGAGKSTLLKILARITEPTSGKVTMQGRVASLLEVGTGFNPELTGRENIYLNGAILGMGRREIENKFAEIVDFAGTREFLDTPVKRYSSGMYVRLAFAVAAHLDSEILLIDEVLAVGDVEFQKKCLKKIDYLAGSGRTIILVSHNMAAVKNICSKVILVENGQIIKIGNNDLVIMKYLKLLEYGNNVLRSDTRKGTLDCEIIDCYLISKGQKRDVFQTGDNLEIAINYKTNKKIDGKLTASINISDSAYRPLILHRTDFKNSNFKPYKKGTISCKWDKLPLVKGIYHLGVQLNLGETIIDAPGYIRTINIESGDFFDNGNQGHPEHSPLLIDAKWENKKNV